MYVSPMKTNMKMDNPLFSIGNTSSNWFFFTIVMLVSEVHGSRLLLGEMPRGLGEDVGKMGFQREDGGETIPTWMSFQRFCHSFGSFP